MLELAQIKKLLSQYTLQDVIDFTLPPTQDIMIPCSSSIAETLRFMGQQNIISAPVYKQPENISSDSVPEVFDIVSLIDVCNYIVYKDNINEEINHQNLTTKAYDNSVFSNPISDVVYKKDTIVGKISGDTPLLQVIADLVQDKYNYALVNPVHKSHNDSENKDLAELKDIPQSGTKDKERKDISNLELLEFKSRNTVVMVKRHDILKFLNSINEQLQQVLDLSVECLIKMLFSKNHHEGEGNSGTSLLLNSFKRSYTNLDNPCHDMILQRNPPSRLQDILYITPNTTALQGYKILLYNEISSLPVLDQNFCFIAELDISHFHHLSRNNVGLLGKPVLAFISGLRSTSASSELVKRPWFCSNSFTLNQIMFGMINSGYRQSWVLDSSNHINAVLSIVDILDVFSKL
ncbi:hypothetical protein BB561_002420 [Smittium simulii]|uniref:CBS domain-containing protein n=1 Tax=Smittium simulii TaxID=133385 RepID=A0A2T9YQG3_9FUNG|nr:hypothetical protein BB561_002420 [Smittium simulii]